MRTINARIDHLESLRAQVGTGGQLQDAKLYWRNERVIAELRWCRAVVRNGGSQSPEWVGDDEVDDQPAP